MDSSPKSRFNAFLLCLFGGGLGLHRFYVGKHLTGVLMVFTFGGLGLWTLIDLGALLFGGFEDSEQRIV